MTPTERRLRTELEALPLSFAGRQHLAQGRYAEVVEGLKTLGRGTRNFRIFWTGLMITSGAALLANSAEVAPRTLTTIAIVCYLVASIGSLFTFPRDGDAERKMVRTLLEVYQAEQAGDFARSASRAHQEAAA